MLGTMQDWELRVSSLLDHAARAHAAREIVTHWADGRRTRTNWQGIRRDALKLVQALRRIEIYPGDRVATLAMNHAHHLSAWFGITGAGCVLHTINPRLFDDQLEFIVNDADDRVLFYDAAFRPIVERMRPRWPSIEHYVCFDSVAFGPGYREMLDREDGEAIWAGGDERQPCMLCYTSGTTGHPKGVLFSHRSNVLHSLVTMAPASLALEPRSCALPVVPMFHANNWGFPWSCAATGAKMVYSQVNDPAVLCDLMTSEGVTHVGGVPTVWFSLFHHLDQTGAPMPPIRVALSGGSAVPDSVVARLMRAGVRVMQAWGMTETSPIATVTWEPPDWEELTFDEQVACKAQQGREIFGCEVRIVSLDDGQSELPHDGVTPGALQVRGHWTIKRYFGMSDDAVDSGQWFDTGDVATMAPDGTLRLTDRTKDLIKSGGEWISSVELENAAVRHPDVLEAAAIGVPHPRWDERPALVVIKRPGSDLTAAQLLDHLAPCMPQWWLPDLIDFVAEIPHTGTGKISKKDLRLRYADHVFTDRDQG